MKTDNLIIGGGLAGSAAAIRLALAGRPVLLVEREKQAQHKVCGEFLSEEALDMLSALGVNLTALGAVNLNAVGFAGDREASAIPLPFRAMSLTRCALDEALLHRAEAAGAQVLRGVSIERLACERSVWRASAGVHEDIAAQTVFVATGKHDLRGRARPPGNQRNLVAFKMYFELTPAQAAEIEGRVELIVYRGGYAGLQPVEAGAANLCCVVLRKEFQRLGGRWENLLEAMQALSPNLRMRLAGARALLQKPLAITPIPYGFVRKQTDGPWYLGDQAAVIPSFTGDGMAIALHSGVLAADMSLRGADAATYQQQLHNDVRRQVQLATLLSQGLVSPAAPAMVAATRLWPGLQRWVACHTRLRPRDPSVLRELHTTS